jgi:hypothetical protein
LTAPDTFELHFAIVSRLRSSFSSGLDIGYQPSFRQSQVFVIVFNDRAAVVPAFFWRKLRLLTALFNGMRWCDRFEQQQHGTCE